MEISSPFHLQPPNNTDGTFRFTKPCSVKIIGSHLIGTSLMPAIKVDVAIMMGKVSAFTHIKYTLIHLLIFVYCLDIFS